MLNLVDLTGKRILVTGASSGIGRSCAILASELGASVVLSGRRPDALEATLADMVPNRDHLMVGGDLTDATDCSDLVLKCGKLDGLVHAAGIAPMLPIGMTDDEALKSTFEINYMSFVRLMRYFAKAKYRNETFSAVAISSIAAHVGWAGVTAYCGSKGALSSSVRALAVELSSKRIRVNAVSPSHIATPLYDAGAASMNDSEALKRLLSRQPLGLGDPRQVAVAVCFLLSDAASFITGVDLPVDGGYLAQ